MLLIFWLIVTEALIFSRCRGPHHPRGEPVVKQHVHYRPTRDSASKLTEDSELLHDTVHLQEHLDEIVEEPDLSKMSKEELEFHYFQVHDTDKNSKLDGLEILQAISHTSYHDEDDGENHGKLAAEDEMNYYIELIDRLLEEDDTDNDGYLSYAEYVTSTKRHKDLDDNKPEVEQIP